MKRSALFALVISLTAVALRAADEEPAIRPDPRPTDLTSKDRPATSDEPKVRPDRRPLDLSAPKTERGGALMPRREVAGLTFDQSEKIRIIRQRAADDVQAIRDRERAEIMAVLNDQQRAEFIKFEDEARSDRPRRATTAPTTNATE